MSAEEWILVLLRPCHKVYQKLDSNTDTGVRYVLDIAGTMTAPSPAEAMGALPVLQPPPMKMSILRILGEVTRLLCGFHWK